MCPFQPNKEKEVNINIVKQVRKKEKKLIIQSATVASRLSNYVYSRLDGELFASDIS